MSDESVIIVTPSEKDFVLGRTLDAGWFQWEITEVTTKAKKDDANRTNIVITSACLGPNDSQGPTAGVEVIRYFAMDDLRWLVKFIKDIGQGASLPAPGQPLKVNALKGVKYDGQNTPREYQGNMQNDIKNCAPLGKFTNK